jgi:uncharacterized metal-binding protein YceD (DUF177 family)
VSSVASLADTIDLGQLGLKPGGGKHFDVRVRIGDFVFGEQHYCMAEDPAPVKIEVSRTTSGNVIRVRMENAIEGPCMRCFGELRLPLEIDHSEVHEPKLEAELASDYVDGVELDLAALVRDAVGLALPTTIASPVDEDGICTECVGSAEQLAKLRDQPGDVEQAQPDPRWAKLRELEL